MQIMRLSKQDIAWLSVYQKQHPLKKHGKYTSDIRLTARALFRSGMRPRRIEAIFGVWSTQVSRWCNEDDRLKHAQNLTFKTSENLRLRNSPEYFKWRKAVYKRDGWTCVNCGYTGNNLHAHHIKSFSKHPKLRFDVNNGETLCRECHAIHHPILRNLAL